MSLLKNINGIELYVVPNQHWIVSAIYPYYKDLEHLFDFSSHDMTAGPCTVNGLQKPLLPDEWTREREDYRMWMLDIFKQVSVPIKEINDRDIGPEYKAWTINYFPGGWQAGHFHSIDKMSQDNDRFASSVMFFDHIKPKKRNKFNGALYTTMQSLSGYTYDHKFYPEPGRVVIMDDRVWHGVYPTEDNRRSLVWDFDIA